MHSSIFNKADHIKESLKGELEGENMIPFWVKALEWPGNMADKISDQVEVRASSNAWMISYE